MNKRIAIIGQGYVGLPLAIEAAKSNYSVIGIDTDLDKVSKLNSSISPVEGVLESDIREQIITGKYAATDNFSEIVDSDIIIICVPTPLDKDGRPNLDFLLDATSNVGKYLSKDTLVIIESTVAPGTTREILLPLLIKFSNKRSSDFLVAFSPERIDPNNSVWKVKNTPKLVSGLTDEALNVAVDFYSKFIDTITKCSSVEIAETAKLLENSFRLINISFINEISIFCNKMGINVEEVISAASTKPYGFMPFYPSIGIGGHCIPVDPIYLSSKAKEIGVSTSLIDLADKVNHEIPIYFVSRAEEKIAGLKDKKVLVVGVSYKPNVADVRETPVEALIFGLKNKGAHVFWHDDLVKDWNCEKSVPLSSDFDLAILATPHDYLDLTKLGNVPILNTRGSI